MIITRHNLFIKNLNKRIVPNKTLYNKFKERLATFTFDPKDPILHNHKLVGGKNNLRSFSVTGDIRVIYYQNNNEIILMDIGSHNQVY